MISGFLFLDSQALADHRPISTSLAPLILCVLPQVAVQVSVPGQSISACPGLCAAYGADGRYLPLANEAESTLLPQPRQH